MIRPDVDVGQIGGARPILPHVQDPGVIAADPGEVPRPLRPNFLCHREEQSGDVGLDSAPSELDDGQFAIALRIVQLSSEWNILGLAYRLSIKERGVFYFGRLGHHPEVLDAEGEAGGAGVKGTVNPSKLILRVEDIVDSKAERFKKLKFGG